MPDRTERFEILPTAAAVARGAADRILTAAQHAIAARGRFNLVLAGGRTPIAAYTLLVGAAADWERWHCFLGDERCLPADHPGRNSVAAARAFLDHVPIPAQNLHLIHAERGPVAAALDYELTLGGTPGAAPWLPFDLVLLGMGEDGHTASLFPGHPIPDGTLVMPVLDAPKPPPQRVSMTPKALSACREILVLVTGADKATALAAWRAGAALPVARVAALGPARVMVDREALGEAPGSSAAKSTA
jgi:6-phosphogluconolactonase